MYHSSNPLCCRQVRSSARNLSAAFGMVIALLATAGPGRAAIYSYEISNYPVAQMGATLTGNISVDTTGGSEDGAGSGNFFVSHSAVIVWNFTVEPTGSAPYIGSSGGINPIVSGSGGSRALYATPTSLSVFQGTSLSLRSDFNTPGTTAQLLWAYDQPLYGSSIVGGGDASWINLSRSDLDNTFPSNPDIGVPNWVIATAVPEPSTGLLGMIAGLGLLARRRRAA